MDNLSEEDLFLIKKSLEYTRLKFEEYQNYPSYEYKQKRICEVNKTLAKVNDIIKERN